MDVAALARRWTELDRARAVAKTDPIAVERSGAARTLVIERLAADPLGRDTLHACAALGTLLAREGASATLAAVTMDGAAEVLGSSAGLEGARAALLEAWSAARDEALRAEHLAAWDAPRCVVALGDGRFAVAAGVPDDDAEVVQRWADRAATWLRKARARRAVLEGGERACTALAEALAVLGVEVERNAR